MSRQRVSRPTRKRRRVASSESASSGPPQGLRLHRFMGVALGGGKTDKTCLSVIEYYPEQKKLFLSRLFDKIKTDGELSSDLQVHRLISSCPPPLESVAFDVPLQLPKCVRCAKPCPGFEECQEPEIEWMWRHYRNRIPSKSPVKLFTPYTERCVEQYLQTELEETFHLPHALGANLAPLTARARFITRRLDLNCVEVYPKLSLWRLGLALDLAKSHLRFHRHWNGGEESRQAILERMIEKDVAFVYDQDAKLLVDSPQAFDSFLCALTGLLSFLGHCEAKPKGFPRTESWIQIPKKSIPWP